MVCSLPTPPEPDNTSPSPESHSGCGDENISAGQNTDKHGLTGEASSVRGEPSILASQAVNGEAGTPNAGLLSYTRAIEHPVWELGPRGAGPGSSRLQADNQPAPLLQVGAWLACGTFWGRSSTVGAWG